MEAAAEGLEYIRLRLFSQDVKMRTCVVCYEQKLFFPELNCCSSDVCWACLASHVDAALGEARERLRCPGYPCAADLGDATVRRCLRRRAARRIFSGGGGERDVRRYERWCVKAGLAASCGARVEEVVECPGLDCDAAWVLPKGLRRRKTRNEPVHPWSPRAWGVFYSPEAARERGAASASAHACDPRRVWCDSCRRAFCLVCRRPWTRPKKGYRPTGVDLWFRGPRYVPPTETHAGKPCAVFANRALRGGEQLEYDIAAEAVGARLCPNCSVRVERTYGCNHIRCPNCSFHWCFVCQEAWGRKHYACRDADGDAFKQARTPEEGCTVM